MGLLLEKASSDEVKADPRHAVSKIALADLETGTSREGATDRRTVRNIVPDFGSACALGCRFVCSTTLLRGEG